MKEWFNAAYPKLAGHFARVITFKTEYAQSAIDDFSTSGKAPHIAISVDMLDTGIDVPEVVNLVLFKLIRSQTKFWQILGRVTRQCPDLFGPGQETDCFYVFDFCQNQEFFGQNPAVTEGALAKSLSERLFQARFDLVRAIEEKQATEACLEMSEGPSLMSASAGRKSVFPRRDDDPRRRARIPDRLRRAHEPRQLHRPRQAPRRRKIPEARNLEPLQR
nr:helicase-related protein [Breoghania corrubedonensis]